MNTKVARCCRKAQRAVFRLIAVDVNAMGAMRITTIRAKRVWVVVKNWDKMGYHGVR